jgi:hypothetical protein
VRESLSKKMSLATVSGTLAARPASPAPQGGIAGGLGGGSFGRVAKDQLGKEVDGKGFAIGWFEGQNRRGLQQAERRLGNSSYFKGKSGAAVRALADFADFDGASAAAGDYTIPGLAATGGKLPEAAKAALEAAKSKEQPAEADALRRLLAKAALLDSAAANLGLSDGSLADEAIQRLNELHQADIKAWSQQLPQLATKLDFVLRDVSLEQAVAAVAKRANLELHLLEGSADDAVALSGGPDAGRVSYLDLRHATVAEALDWILQPARLRWQLEGKSIVAGSDRRVGNSGWTYDVSAIALPLDEDLKKLGDDAKMRAEAQKAADDFLAAVRAAIKADEGSLVWFAPGQLLLFGTPGQHEKLAQTIASLQAGVNPLAEPLTAIGAATRQRFAARREKLAKAAVAERNLNVAMAHDQFSWQLLSAAAGGKLDLEALTELQIAWQTAQTAELLTGESRPLVLRSLWAVCQAARALPAEKELALLAESARQKSNAAIAAALTDAGTSKGSLPILASAVYAALANPADAAYRGKLLTLLATSETDEATRDLRLLGRVLLSEKVTDADRKSLNDLLTAGVGGADPALLVALACRKAGGATWEQFRAHSGELLGEQPLPGEVVVLINRLPALN